MKIVQASTHFSNNFEKVNSVNLLPMDEFRPKFESHDLVLNKTLPICETLLKKENITADQIGLILSISITPDRLVYDKSVGAPRLCHPLQKFLKAKNAFVFDLLDSDWNTALTIADGFIKSQNYNYGLIVRSEITHGSILPDLKSGFTIADGVSAILVKESQTPILTEYKELPSSKNINCRVDLLNQQELAKGKHKAQFTYNFDSKYLTELNNTGNDLLEKITQQKPSLCISESWFKGHELNSLPEQNIEILQTRQSELFNHLGPYTFPFYCEKLLHQQGSSQNTKIGNINYNPFLKRYSATIVQLAKNSNTNHDN